MASNRYPLELHHPNVGAVYLVHDKDQEAAWREQGWRVTAPAGVEEKATDPVTSQAPPAPSAPKSKGDTK